MFPLAFPKSPCSWNVEFSTNWATLQQLIRSKQAWGIEQEILGQQPYRRSEGCRVHVDCLNGTKIMINQTSCRFKWDGDWKRRQSPFFQLVLLLSQPYPRLRCFPWGTSAWSWVWWVQLRYGLLYFLFSFSLVFILQRACRSESAMCISSHTAGFINCSLGREVPRWDCQLKNTGNMILRKRLSRTKVYKFTGDASAPVAWFYIVCLF